MTPTLFNEPQDQDIKIWRYIDFQQLYYLLNFNKLNFSSPKLFDDSLEGVLPEMFKKEVLDRVKNGNREQIETEFSNLFFFNEDSNINKIFLDRIYISCWHESEHETMSMWKLYGGIQKGIAITSTFKKLSECLNENFFIGRVEYIDGKSKLDDTRNFVKKFFYKRMPYWSEKEIRAIYFQPYLKPLLTSPVYDFDINPYQLIDEIVISPFATNTFSQSVKDLVKDKLKCGPSTLSSESSKKMANLQKSFFQLINGYAKKSCVRCEGNGYVRTDSKYVFCPACIDASTWDGFKEKLLTSLTLR